MNEKIFVEINGLKQGMFIQSENTNNPVLLFLHGGPGSPEVAFSQEYPTGLEKIFTVCWWEQRGSCISYHRHISKDCMTIEQMVSDTIEVTNYLRKRFFKEKVYVMGHSWGTVLGIMSVQKMPELFHAYMGIGQVARQDESERLAYTYMLEEFRALGEKKMVNKLLKYPLDKGSEISNMYLSVRSAGMVKLGIGVMHNCRSMFDCVKMVFRFKGYTLSEKIKYVLGNNFGLECLWDYVIGNDFSKLVPSLSIPVYIFQGKYDYQVSYVVAKDYASKLKAPLKGFYTFENSAHSPCFEEPEKMCHIILADVLREKTDLADNS